MWWLHGRLQAVTQLNVTLKYVSCVSVLQTVCIQLTQVVFCFWDQENFMLYHTDCDLKTTDQTRQTHLPISAQDTTPTNFLGVSKDV